MPSVFSELFVFAVFFFFSERNFRSALNNFVSREPVETNPEGWFTQIQVSMKMHKYLCVSALSVDRADVFMETAHTENHTFSKNNPRVVVVF